METLNTNIKIMNKLNQSLLEDIDKVRKGEMSLAKAKVINNLAVTSVKSNIAILISHQDIQFKKIKLREKELEFKKSELDYKIKKFKL